MRLSFKKAFYSALFLGAGISLQAQQSWTLEEMVQYAKKNNLNLQETRLQTDVLQNNVIAAHRQKLPSVQAQVSNDIVLGVTGIPIANSNQITSTTNGYQLYQNSLGLSSSLLLYNKGNLRLKEEKAVLDLHAAEEGLKAAENNITLRIINFYLNILLQKELLRTANEQLKVSENQLEQNELLYKGGAIALSQVYEAKSKVAQDKQRVATAKINLKEAHFSLAQLLQLDYQTFEVATIDLPPQPERALIDVNEVISYASTHQPVIKNALLSVESAEKEVEIAKTALYPSISATYQVGTNYRDYFNKGIPSDPLFKQWWNNHSHAIGVAVQIPIFNKNLTKLNIETQQLQTDIARKKVAIEKQNLKQEIQTAYFRLETHYEEYTATLESVKAAEISFDFAQKSHDAGRITLYDFNQSANALFNAKSLMIQAKYNYLFSLKVLDFYQDKPLTL